MAKKKSSKKVDVQGVSISTPASEQAEPVTTESVAVMQSEVHITQEQITEKAREIWISRGQPGGQDMEIWLEAERELRGG